MISREIKIIAGIIAISLVLFALTTVNALAVNGPYYASLGQCETIKEKYTVCADVTGTYNISVTGSAAKWVLIAPNALALDANSCGDFYAFITPECYANSGDYNASILVKGPESSTTNVEVVVTQSHTFNYSVTPLSNSSKPCEDNVYNVYIKNTGKFTDEFVLAQVGLPNGWATYPQQKFLINPYSEYTTPIVVKSACNTVAGNYPFKLNLSNTRTNAFGSKDLNQTITKFVPISFGGLFTDSSYYKANSCEEFDKKLTFTAVNLSDKNDVLTVYLVDSNKKLISKDLAYFENSTIKLDVGTPVEVSMIVKKHAPMVSGATIVVYSKNYDMNFEANIDFVFENCYDLNIEKATVEETSCFGAKDQVFKVSNTGTKAMDVNISLSVDNNIVQTKTITIDSNSVENVTFTITPSKVGKINETVKAVSQFEQQTISFPYAFENCYDASMDAGNILVCKHGVVNQQFVFSNKGTATQNFKLSIDSNWLYFTSSEVLIGGGENKSVTLVGGVPEIYPTSQTITATSVAGTLSKTVSVITLPNEECNDMNFVIQKTVDANCCEGTIIPLVVTNTGYFDQEIAIRAIVPPWVTVSEEAISLLPKASRTIYVYVAPPVGTEGDYNASITISNDANISKEINFKVNVAGSNCKLVVGGDVNVNSNVSDTKVFTRKEVTVDFIVSNDSNVGFNVNNITLDDSNSTVDFNKGIFLMPGQSTIVKLTTQFAEGEVSDKNVNVLIETSAGNFQKVQTISYASNEAQGASITGWFSAYSVPIVGLLLVVLLALIVLALVSKKAATSARKPKFKK